MHVGHVPMSMAEPLMTVRMGVRLARRIVGRMRVLMMLVVNMQMLVLHRLMHVLMLVHFRDMQPHADCHEHTRSRELQR